MRRGKGSSGERYERDMDEEMTNVDLRRLCRKEICNDSSGSDTTRIVGGE